MRDSVPYSKGARPYHWIKAVRIQPHTDALNNNQKPQKINSAMLFIIQETTPLNHLISLTYICMSIITICLTATTKMVK